jgi:hypothetical protein
VAAIDRAEHIDGHYVVEDGSLRLISQQVDVVGWYPPQINDFVARLHQLHDAGGVVVGSWEGSRLVALASLDIRPVGDDPQAMDSTCCTSMSNTAAGGSPVS